MMLATCKLAKYGCKGWPTPLPLVSVFGPAMRSSDDEILSQVTSAEWITLPLWQVSRVPSSLRLAGGYSDMRCPGHFLAALLELHPSLLVGRHNGLGWVITSRHAVYVGSALLARELAPFMSHPPAPIRNRRRLLTGDAVPSLCQLENILIV